ncbi:MAG TPA: HYR domain-containing protein, partial [Petrimonas sp.]|nr:HYR domain-containing protein [Petrimonas sp.]
MTALLAGQTYPVEVVAKTNNLYKEYVKIWFDFNGNGVLSDPNEMVFAAGNSFNGTYVYAGNITIPSDAFNGEVYIRVVMVYNNSPALCGSYQYGTTMDIKATIMGGKVPRKLTVKVGEGEELRGRVESTPSGINTDKGLNSANFADSSVVTLTAFPAANAEFVNWEGDASGTNPVLTVNMDAAKDITARFALLPPPPSPTAITTASPAICEGETALLTVENAVGTVHWYTGSCGGDLVVTGNPISVKPSSSTVYYARNYTAGGFSAECASIEITVAPKGVGGTISGENALICNGKSTGQMTLTGNVGVVQRWEKRVDGGEWQPITHTGEDYSETPSSVGAWDYRAVIKNGICSEVNSALWSVHVDGSAPIMTTPAADLTVCDQAGSNDLLNTWLANHGGANATDDYHSVTWSNNFDADNWTAICKNVKSQQVVFTATDDCGYQSTTSAVFTVEDTAAVSIVCKDITLYLDASGSVSVPIDQMADVAVESCGFVSISVSPDAFYCSDVGENTVTLSVRDFCNNLTTCSAVVTVRDTLAPVFSKPVVPVLPKTISQLGHKSTYSNVRLNGGSNLLTVSPGAQVTLTANWSAAYDGGGGCGGCITQHHIGLGNIFSECHAMSSGTGTINKTFTAPVVPGIYYINQQATWWFYCGQFARPVHNNDHNTAIAVLVVADESFGACIPDFTVKTDPGSRRAVVNYFPPVAVDNCSSTTTQTEGLPSGSEFEFGTTLNTFVATDDAGNTSSCSFVVTVVDKEPPVALCKDVTVYLDEAGQASIDHHAVDNGSNDLFGIYSLVTSKVNFTCSDECSGSEESCPEVTLTVTDMNGNVSTCTSQVTVLDTISPKALSKDITVFLDETGNVLITAADVDGGSSDACGIASMSVSPNTFTCEEVGENSVVLTVTDNNGNTSTATAVVTVEDKIAPEAVGKNITIQLDASGAALIVPPHIEAGSSDACGIASISVSPNVFTCEEVGENSVVLTVTDN